MNLIEFMLLKFDDDKKRVKIIKNIIYDYELHSLSFNSTFLVTKCLENARACHYMCIIIQFQLRSDATKPIFRI